MILALRTLLVTLLFVPVTFVSAGEKSSVQNAAKLPVHADLILTHGRIYTVEEGQPWADAVAIRGDKILAVGSEAELNHFRGPRTKTIDLRGRFAMPGMIDSHLHFRGGSLALEQVNLDGAYSMAEMKQRVREYAGAHPEKKWIVGRGWLYTSFAPGGLPDKRQLDEWVSDRPAILEAYDGHTNWANSRALAAAHITRDTPDPPGGMIVKHPATGEPTGALKEAAGDLVTKLLPKPTRAEALAALRKGLKLAARSGLTSVVNADGSLDDLALFEALRSRGELTLRIYMAMNLAPTTTGKEIADFEKARKLYRGPWVRAGVIKGFMDGVIESHTAAMLEPYADDPELNGKPNFTQKEIDRLVTELDRRGFQVMLHAIGDGGIRMALNAYENALKANGPRDRRFRIEHIESISPVDIPRFAGLGVIASFQPYHCYPEPNLVGIWARNVGHERLPYSFAWNDIRRHGARLAFGSDWPVVSLSPWIGLQNAVTRQTDDGQPPGGWVGAQRVTLPQAIRAYTLDAAYAEFEDRRKGSLRPGKLADIIVLSQNPFEISPLKIRETKVLLTIVGGRIVHRDPI